MKLPLVKNALLNTILKHIITIIRIIRIITIITMQLN